MKVKLETTVEAGADVEWETVGDFNALPEFVAAATQSEMSGDGVGALRTLTLPDGAQIIEKLESYDHDAKTLVYSILSGPLPVEDYRSTMAVTPAGPSRCAISWSSTFTPSGASEEEARQAIEGIYQMGFEGLKKLFERPR